MTMDQFLLHAVVSEAASRLVEHEVLRVVSLGRSRYVLRFTTPSRDNLLLCVRPDLPRLHLLGARRLDEEPPDRFAAWLDQELAGAGFTLNFSKGASQVIGQYYQMIRLGKRGYRCIMINLTRTADYLAAALKDLGFIIMSDGRGRGLPLVAFRLDPRLGMLFDEFALAHQLRERGWVVPAYTMAPHSGKLKLMRVVVREDFSRSRCDVLVNDIRLALGVLSEMDKRTMEKYQEWVTVFPSPSLLSFPIFMRL